MAIQKKALLDILADEKENGPEDTTQDDDMKQSIVKWLFELNAKQREVLARRFGLLGYEAATLEDVGREIGLTRANACGRSRWKVCVACGKFCRDRG